LKRQSAGPAIAVLAVLLMVSSAFVPVIYTSAPAAGSNSSGYRLGFWIDERDMWSGVGFGWTPQQFVTNYFDSPPYPSVMLFATGMTPSGPDSPGAMGEASWLSQVASLCVSQGLNCNIIVIFFVNLSGGTISGVADQTAELQQYLQTLGPHSNIVGMEYETEYYGNTAAEEQSFYNIVTGAGYTDIFNPSAVWSYAGEPTLDYSTYPYYSGVIPTSLSANSMGASYGETGPPNPPASGSDPAWTQQTVQAIIDNSPGNPYVLIYSDDGGSGQPQFQLWNWSTLQQWIWTDPNYQANFLLSTAAPSTTSTTSHSTSTSSSTTTTSRTSKTSTTSTSATSTTSTTSAASTTSADTTTTSTSTATTSSTTETTTSNTTTSSTSTSTSSTSSTTVLLGSTTSTTTRSIVPPSFSLNVIGGCPAIGAGSYAEGSVATVVFQGVCNRDGQSGLRVTSWSIDGGPLSTVSTNASSTISILMDSAHTLTFNTVAQYPLDFDYGARISMLSVTPSSIAGDNYWYDAGTSVTFFGKVSLGNLTVTGYALDSATPTSVSGIPVFESTFAMDGPHTLHVDIAPISAPNSTCSPASCGGSPNASVTIQTNTNLPSGVWVDGSYYPSPVTFTWQEGSVHNITAALGVARSSVRTTFSGWSGLSNSRASTIMLSVNGSGVLSALYSTSYLVSLSFSDATRAPIVPQSVSLSGPMGVQVLGPNLTAWVEPGVQYRIASATWMNWNIVMSNDSTFEVVQPAQLSFTTQVYQETIKVDDAYGLPLQGAMVNVTSVDGTSSTAITNSQGVAQFKVPVGVFSAAVSYLGVTDQVVAGSPGSHAFTVTFLLSYPLLATVVAVSAIGVVFAFLLLKRKGRSGLSLYYYDEA
jgi:hypothetical protein